MALSLNDVEKIAKLSRLTLTDEEKNKTLAELNDIFAMVENMQSVNTDGIEPMAHPHEAALRLREDKVTETDHAAEYQAVAPEVRNRLYIVPQVIEEQGFRRPLLIGKPLLQGRLKGYFVQTARFIDLNGCFQYLF